MIQSTFPKMLLLMLIMYLNCVGEKVGSAALAQFDFSRFCFMYATVEQFQKQQQNASF